MIRYLGAAAVSRMLSASAAGRWLYHRLGSVVLERTRVAEGLPARYLDRAERLLTLCGRYDVLAPGDRVLEIGTGWAHWEGTVLALHHDVRVTLFDVRDNRRLAVFRTYLAGYRRHLETRPGVPGRGRALALLDRLATAEDFATAYEILGVDYVVDPSGDLAVLDSEAYALEVSADVLEHVPAAALPGHLAAARECLRPGGWAIHQIDLVDHLAYFDPTVSPKHFFRYDDRTWRRWFDSDVQHVNRVQRPQWRELFGAAGFMTVEDDEEAGPVEDLPLAPRFARLSPADRACLRMLTVHQRPVACR